MKGAGEITGSPECSFVAGASYSGWLRADIKKYFLSFVTREAGLETWTWDGQPVPPGGCVSQPGVLVTWDTKNDRLLVSSDQTQLLAIPHGEAISLRDQRQGQR